MVSVGHGLLIDAVAAELAKSPDAKARASYNRGVRTVRRQAIFSDAFVRTTEMLNRPAHPRR
jgi:hypothetical protein